MPVFGACWQRRGTITDCGLDCTDEPALTPAGLAVLVRRFVAPDVQMLDGERAVMRGHFFVMLPRHRIERAFGAAFEHFGFLLEVFCLGHGFRSRLSDQAGDVEDRDADHGADGPEGGIPAFRLGAVIFHGSHDTASKVVNAPGVHPPTVSGRLRRPPKTVSSGGFAVAIP